MVSNQTYARLLHKKREICQEAEPKKGVLPKCTVHALNLSGRTLM